MKNLILFTLFVCFFAISCKKSEDPKPSTPNNPVDTTKNHNPNNPTNPTNTPPLLESNLTYTATTATALQIDLTTKITDAQNDTWSLTTATVLHGTATITGKVISYTSNTSYTGNDTITITITDSKGATSTGKITITVSASSPTNHAPVVNSSSNITFYSIQWLGNTYGYNISIKSQPATETFNVTDDDNDNVAITSITGYSSNIQEIRGVATNISSEDIANGNFNGDIQIIPNSRVYAGTETFTITFSDGKSTTTKTFTIQFGSNATVETYDILSQFFGQTLNGDAAGNFIIKANGTITSNANYSFYGDACTPTTASPATYKISGYFIEITSACGIVKSYQVASITNGGQGFSMDSFFVIQ